MTKTFRLATGARDIREQGRIVLAHGEVTGHCHEVLSEAGLIPQAQFFEEPDGRRILLVMERCLVRHQEHAPIIVDPTVPTQVRQGDVLLQPLGPGAWEVIRQREWDGPEAWRAVAD